MAEREGGGGSPWVAFLAGIILVAVVAFGVVAYTGGLQQRGTAQLELNVPDVKSDHQNHTPMTKTSTTDSGISK